jgi:hypothetical protein
MIGVSAISRAFLPPPASDRLSATFNAGDRSSSRLMFIFLTLLLVGCRTKDETPIDPFQLAPFLSSLTVTPTSFNTDTINVGPQRLPSDSLTLNVMVTAQVSDPDGVSGSRLVTARIFKPSSKVVAQSAALRLTDSSRFSALVPLKIVRTDIGEFRFEVSAQNSSGLASNSLSRSVTIERLNHPPVVSDLQSPDTLTVGVDSLFMLHIRAVDPDGQSDIIKAFFNSFLPSGSASSGNPFEMFDDGNPQHGDAVAGDGIYSLIARLPATASRGTYRFEFQAIDRSGASSNVITHFINVR